MKTTFFAAGLLATSAMAAPFTQHGNIKRAPQTVNRDDAAGIMINAPSSNNSWTGMAASFKVPEVKPATSGTSNASIWVGLGMDTNRDFKTARDGSLLRTGVRVSASNNKTSYSTFWDFLPDHSVELNSTEFDIKAGDTITAHVRIDMDSDSVNTTSHHGKRANSTSGSGSGRGVVLFQNSRTKMIQEHALFQKSVSPRLGSCVDLAVSGDAKLANFGTVNFSLWELAAHGPFGGNGAGYADELNDAMVLNMAVGGKNLASAKILNGTAVQVKYTGA